LLRAVVGLGMGMGMCLAAAVVLLSLLLLLLVVVVVVLSLFFVLLPLLLLLLLLVQPLAWPPRAPDLRWGQGDGQLLVVVGLGHGCRALRASSRLKCWLWVLMEPSRLCALHCAVCVCGCVGGVDVRSVCPSAHSAHHRAAHASL